MNEIKLGDIGVCLSDYDDTGAIYRVCQFWIDGSIHIQKIDNPEINKWVTSTDFWSLV